MKEAGKLTFVKKVAPGIRVTNLSSCGKAYCRSLPFRSSQKFASSCWYNKRRSWLLSSSRLVKPTTCVQVSQLQPSHLTLFPRGDVVLFGLSATSVLSVTRFASGGDLALRIGLAVCKDALGACFPALAFISLCLKCCAFTTRTSTQVGWKSWRKTYVRQPPAPLGRHKLSQGYSTSIHSPSFVSFFFGCLWYHGLDTFKVYSSS